MMRFFLITPLEVQGLALLVGIILLLLGLSGTITATIHIIQCFREIISTGEYGHEPPFAKGFAWALVTFIGMALLHFSQF